MARKNRTATRPQRLKYTVEDRMARRALQREVDRSYRDEAPQRTFVDGHLSVITFTDPSYAGGA